MRLIKKKEKKRKCSISVYILFEQFLNCVKPKLTPILNNSSKTRYPFCSKLAPYSIVSNPAPILCVYFIFPCIQLKYIDFSDSQSHLVSHHYSRFKCVWHFFQLWDSYKWCDSYLNQPEFINRIISTRLIRVRTGLFTKCTRTISDMKTRPSSNKISP